MSESEERPDSSQSRLPSPLRHRGKRSLPVSPNATRFGEMFPITSGTIGGTSNLKTPSGRSGNSAIFVPPEGLEAIGSSRGSV